MTLVTSTSDPVPDPDTTLGVLTDYPAPAAGFDTMKKGDGALTEAWQGLGPRLERLGATTIEDRHQRITSVFDEGGALLARPTDSQAPLSVDPIPFPMAASTHEQLSESVCERARILNLLLADLLGEQRTLREKVVPPALLFSNPFYYRAYHGLPVSGDRYVHLYGSDLVQISDGSWWALRDLTRAPSGLGSLLAHRIALARIHGDWFHSMHVRRLTPALDTLRETLARLAPRNRSNPRIVVLGHDPETQRGYEDEFLARNLGYSLVVADDIATRKGQVVLKTLGGTIPIEVILRRVDDATTDPVELRPDGSDGAAGLVDSQRQEQVAIANMLGSQIVESPAFLAFLDPVRQFFEGSGLSLPSIATWWCGQPAALREVLAGLDEMLILDAFYREAPPIDPRRLNKEERRQLIGRLEARPQQYAAQRRTAASTTPAWENGTLVPRSWSLRVFATLGEENHELVPGGLVQLSDDQRDVVADPRIANGGRVQDCWVLSNASVHTPPLSAPEDETGGITRGGAELSSRVAERLYWLGRRVEAAENRARLLRALLTRVWDDSPDASATDIDTLVGTSEQNLVEEEADSSGALSLEESPWLQFFEIVAPDNPLPETVTDAIQKLCHDLLEGGAATHSLSSLLLEGQRLARSVRDRVSVDAWRLMGRAARRVRTHAGQVAAHDLLAVSTLLDQIVLDTAGFAGLMSESMTRTLAWRFLDMGRRLQRALHGVELLRVGLSSSGFEERSRLEMLLEVCDSSMTYRSRYLADLRVVPLLDLLITDESNPRSVGFQLAVLDDHLRALPRELTGGLLDSDQRALLGLLSAVRLAGLPELAERDVDTQRPALVALLDRIQTELPIVERALTARYLVHADLPKQFASIQTALIGGDTASDTPDGVGGDLPHSIEP